jgi:hypothetical protein
VRNSLALNHKASSLALHPSRQQNLQNETSHDRLATPADENVGEQRGFLRHGFAVV